MIDLKQLKAESSIVDVIGRYVHLEKNGPHHKGLCPFHEDTKPTLTVTESKKLFKCFACGESGDQFDFLIKMGKTMKDAVQEIKDGEGMLDINPIKVVVPKKEETIWSVSYPFPQINEISHYKYGKPSMVWNYLDATGNVLLYVCRFNLSDGSKEVLPFVYAENKTGKKDWRWMSVPEPKPLYNLDLIHKFPNAAILIVEGEKTADAAQKNLDPSKIIATTWLSGANGINKVDFSPLTGRYVLYLPDHDTDQRYGDKHPKAGKVKPWHEQPGNFAMLSIHNIIKEKVKDHRWVNVPASFPNKWDVADKEWNENELFSFIKQNIVDVPIVNAEIEDAFENSESMDIPEHIDENYLPEKKQNNNYENDYFRFLGYDKDDSGKIAYYFFSYDAKTLVKLSPSSMNVSNLMMLAPINWWEQNFPGAKSAVNINAAQQFMIGYSHEVGPFKEKLIRGRGAWIDNKKVVFHCGDNLLIEGKKIPIKNFKSKYVYEIAEKVDFKTGQILPEQTGKDILEMIKELRWERGVNSYLLAGWCVIAPFCGVLNWRPHIWITGPAGSGKSWTTEHIVKRLIGNVGLVMQGKTTEAYVRGKLQNDAIPVLFDEGDVDSASDKERIQSVLALARSSSYGNGGAVGKGTQTGGAKEYFIRSMFCMVSIGVQLNQQSDKTRFSQLGLMSFEGYKSDDDFIKFHDKWMSLVTDDVIVELHSRTFKLLPVIIKNAKTFALAVEQEIGTRRVGDQLGSLLAGAYSLISSKEVTLEKAKEWVKSKDWSEEKGLEQTKDENQLLMRLLSHVTFVDGQFGKIDRSIGEMISFVSGRLSDVQQTAISTEGRLKRLGIIIKNDRIIIANTSSEIAHIIKDTSWSSNYNKILERIPGAEKVESRTFAPGLRSRGVSLPLDLISVN